jgi:hypothetical protein
LLYLIFHIIADELENRREDRRRRLGGVRGAPQRQRQRRGGRPLGPINNFGNTDDDNGNYLHRHQTEIIKVDALTPKRI